MLIDDLIATGGTMVAASKLLQRLGANVVEAAAIIDLPDLGGSKVVEAAGLPVYTCAALRRLTAAHPARRNARVAVCRRTPLYAQGLMLRPSVCQARPLSGRFSI